MSTQKTKQHLAKKVFTYDEGNVLNYTFSCNSKDVVDAGEHHMQANQSSPDLKFSKFDQAIPGNLNFEGFGAEKKIIDDDDIFNENGHFLQVPPRNGLLKADPVSGSKQTDSESRPQNPESAEDTSHPDQSLIMKNQSEFISRTDLENRIVSFPKSNVIGFMYLPKQVVEEQKFNIYLSRSCRGLRGFFR